MKKTRLITVTSGKGGVGKTNISVNLALCLADQGYRTCLFDADLGLANVNILLGIYPEKTLGDVILKKAALGDIVVSDAAGFDIVPGSSGVDKLADLDNKQLAELVKSFLALGRYDFFLVDTAAGISRSVISFCTAASEILLVITPEPTSLTDGYALLKVLSMNGFQGNVRVLVNQVKNMEDAKRIFLKFQHTVHRFLPVGVDPGGAVVADRHVVSAVQSQQPFFLRYPDSEASRCIRNIGRYLLKRPPADDARKSMGEFWIQFLKQFRGPMQLGNEKREAAVPKPVPQPASPTPGMAAADGDAPGSFPPGNIEGMLASLVTQVAAMSRDLGAIRKAMEAGRSTTVRRPGGS